MTRTATALGLALLLGSCAAIERNAAHAAFSSFRDLHRDRLAASFRGTLTAPTWAGSTASMIRMRDLVYGGGRAERLLPRATGRRVRYSSTHYRCRDEHSPRKCD